MAKYTAQLQQAELILSEIRGQVQGAQSALDATSAQIAELERRSQTTADKARNADQMAALRTKLSSEQAQLQRMQAEQRNAALAVSKYQDLEANPEAADTPAEVRELELNRQRFKNKNENKGFFTDAEVEANAKRDAAQAEATGARKDATAVQREGIAAANQRTERQVSSAEQAQAARLKFDQDKLSVDERLKRGELTLKEAELELNRSFNDAKIKIENINTQLAAARDINTMGVTQRAQDISLMELGEKTSAGALGMVERMLDYMPEGTVMTEDDIIRVAGKYDDFMFERGQKRRDAAPKVEPHKATVKAAEGKMAVPTSRQAEEIEKRRAERKAKKAGSVDEAFDMALQDKYDEWAAAKAAAGDTSSATIDDFRSHLKATGTQEEALPADEALQKLPAFKAGAAGPQAPGQAPAPEAGPSPAAPPAPGVVPEGTVRPAPLGPETPPPVAQPIPRALTADGVEPAWMPARTEAAGGYSVQRNQSPEQGKVEINIAPAPNVVQPEPPTAPPEQVLGEQFMAQENQKIKSEMHNDAAARQTVKMMQESGVSPETIQAWQQKHGVNLEQLNPLDDYLEMQLQPPMM